MLGRRGPAQAAFTNPEVRELGEMVDADIDIDAGEMELDDLSREWLDSDDADPTNRRNVDIFTDFAQREPEGKNKRIVMRFLRSPVEIQGDGKVERIVVGQQRAAAGRLRAAPRGRHRRARDDRVRPGLAIHRLQGDPDRGHPLRRGPRPDPQRGRARPRRRGRAGARPLRGRLDQAGALRRDRDQQEGRSGDRRQPLRRPRGRNDPRGGARPPTGARSRPCSTSASPTTSPSRAGRRSTPPRWRPASLSAARASSSAAFRSWSRPRRPPRRRPEPASAAEAQAASESAYPTGSSPLAIASARSSCGRSVVMQRGSAARTFSSNSTSLIVPVLTVIPANRSVLTS